MGINTLLHLIALQGYYSVAPQGVSGYPPVSAPQVMQSGVPQTQQQPPHQHLGQHQVIQGTILPGKNLILLTFFGLY